MNYLKFILFYLSFLLANITIAQNDSTAIFLVDGKCEMCQERIEKAAKTKGVSAAKWNVESKKLQINYNPKQVKLITIHQSIAAVGHDTKLIKASQEVYKNLHSCCKYREEEEEEEEFHSEKEYLTSQSHNLILKGKINELGDENKKEPVFSANIYWKETSRGVTSDEKGNFEIEKHLEEKTLIISFVGLISDTILIKDEAEIEVVLSNSVELQEFAVISRQKSTEISKFKVLNTQQMGKKELAKAACCNLSESFETNPSVDVSYSDAVTGTKQIKMLGLSGANVQITKELLPDIRGFSSVYGLEFVPGDWIESIQLIKGTGSVINGYESIAGQINVELKKPEESEKFHINLYGNNGGRIELNTNFKFKINSKWTTGFLLHSSARTIKNDRNKDGFLDNPLTKSFIGINRWKYEDSTGLQGQIGVEGVSMESSGGQLNFNKNQEINIVNPWGAQSQISRIKGWGKLGKIFYEKPGKSIAIQLTGSSYTQKSSYGINNYEAKQNNGYANLIFQNLIGTSDHTYFAGVSFLLDEYKEEVNSISYDRTEITPGVFGEYTFSGLTRFKFTLGLRADYSNLFEFFVTPRLHLKYDITENSILRVAAGRGQRSANIFSENQAIFATSRKIILVNDSNSNKPYGLNSEVAWNFGINLTQDFSVGKREGVISLDLYRTQFQNQIIVDWENPDEVSFYNLHGESFSNSLQFQVDYEIIENLDIRIAYRFYDIKTTFNDILLQKQLTAQHRSFLNLSYETKKKWSVDFTLNWIGEQRVASTNTNPEAHRVAEKSPSYFLANAQISKKWSSKFNTYIGVENIFDFRMDKPIIDSENPFGNNFDSSLIWAPIFGRNIYIGLKYSL